MIQDTRLGGIVTEKNASDSGVAPGDAHQPGLPPSGQQSPQGNDHPWWRWLVFLGIAILTGVPAFVLKGHGKSATEPATMTAGTSQEINVYASDPSLEVGATLVVFWNAGNPYEVLYLAAQGTGKQSAYGDILVTSNTPDASLNQSDIATNLEPPHISMDERLKLINVRSGYDVETPAFESLFAEEVPMFYINESDARGKYGVPVAAFRISSLKAPIADDTGGTYFAHLPLLNSAQDTPFADQPQFMAEFVPPYDRGKIDADLIQLPNLTGNAENRREKAGTLGEPDVTLSDYQSLLNEPAALYWEPQSVTSIEVLKNVKPKLDNANDSIVPSGNFSGNDYIWQNTDSLEPTIVAAQLDSADSKSNDLFLSGIFFALSLIHI